MTLRRWRYLRPAAIAFLLLLTMLAAARVAAPGRHPVNDATWAGQARGMTAAGPVGWSSSPSASVMPYAIASAGQPRPSGAFVGSPRPFFAAGSVTTSQSVQPAGWHALAVPAASCSRRIAAFQAGDRAYGLQHEQTRFVPAYPCLAAASSAPAHRAVSQPSIDSQPTANGKPLAASAIAPVRLAASSPAIRSDHPRLLLDSATLTALRARTAANTTEWQLLKAVCDSYIGGKVNYPAGDAYPNKPDLGSGYQGETYLPALLAEGMCYQVLKVANPAAAAPYGAKAVDILLKMSAPYVSGSGNLGWNPCTDSGYGIRFYGVGYGLGYDWVYELLTPTQRTQVYTAGNAWITAWEATGGCADFEYQHPQSNYYAGYFHAKAAIALGTYGDNPAAPAQWDDWYANQYGQRVQPFYANHLVGGGWPEGYGNYASLAIFNMSLPAREVMTATGQDLVHATAAYRFPLDSADYAMHFTWPSRAYFDDRDTNHANGTPTPPVGTTQVGMFEQMRGELAYWKSPNAAVFNQYLNDVSSATSGYNSAAPWLLFLETDPAAPVASVAKLPRSYLATGLGAVAARSDWSTAASWMSFRAGPYVNNPAQGEEGFDQGSLALVRGNTPLLVNTFGWMVHEPNGSADENLLYNDLFGTFNNTPYMGNRQMYNVFYVRRMSGSSVIDRYGQAAYTTEGNQVRTAIAAYDDRDDYVYVQATHLEDMYRPLTTGPGVAGWSRQIIYLRPNRFVVYDRTIAGSANYDQYLAWHFPANPVAGAAATDSKRLDVTYAGQFAGAMTVVLPTKASTTTVPLYPASNPVKVWQVQVRPSDNAPTQQWLTVFDLSPTASKVALASPVTINQGAVVGVQLAASDGNAVVIQSAGAAGTPVSGTVAYTVPAVLAHHVVTELAPATGYNISVSTGSSTQTVSVSPGGTYTTSAKGVLDFYVNAGGTVQETPPAILTVPVSSLPVSGYPQPYHP